MKGAPILVLVCLLLLSLLSTTSSGGDTATPTLDPIVLRVGSYDEMKTRNVLNPVAAFDQITEDVLARVYESVVLEHPTEERPLAYIAKGVDADEDGTFEVSEYDHWSETNAQSPLEATVYYDFNGVRWHDGMQMTVWDLLFSYHVNAMHPTLNGSLQVLVCTLYVPYDACGRQLGVNVVDLNPATATLEKSWEGEQALGGDASLRVALTYRLAEPFVQFAETTLAPRMLPMHLWSRTGGGRHADFGCAVWIPGPEAVAKGLPECANPDAPKWGLGIAATEPVPGSTPFVFAGASGAIGWNVNDEDVIGHGPFEFDKWVPGIGTDLVRYEDYAAGGAFDSALARIVGKPNVEAIHIQKYGSPLLAVEALKADQIDYVLGWVAPEFTIQLQLCCTEIGVESAPEASFAYLAYNLRMAPWGYQDGDPARDVGYWLRRATAHLTDKRTIVQNLLQNFGVVGHGTVSPANTFWYNDNIPKLAYDRAQAAAILDSAEARAAGFGPDPPGDCSKDTPAGCRSLPLIGTTAFEILTPLAELDPILAVSSSMIAGSMRSVGLNTATNLVSMAQMLKDPNGVLNRGFGLFVSRTMAIRTSDPDFHYALFHRANAAQGGNHWGLHNGTVDSLVEQSRRELDRATRQLVVHELERALAEIRPLEVLYFRTGFESYRLDGFVNWTMAGGTLWNYWSLLGIRKPLSLEMRVSIGMVSSLLAGETTTVTISVKDNSGVPLSDATIVLHASDGILTYGTISGAVVTGTTNANGQLQALFQAPALQATTPVLLDVVVMHPAFAESARSDHLVVMFPEGRQFLRLDVNLPAGDLVDGGSQLPMTILVRDQDGGFATASQVLIESLGPEAVTADPAQGGAGDMTHVMLFAPETRNATHEVIVVRAELVGYEATATSVIVYVHVSIEDVFCPDGSRSDANGNCPEPTEIDPAARVLISTSLAAAITVTLFVLFRRVRGPPRNKP